MIIKPPDSLQARLAAQRERLDPDHPASAARLRGLHAHLRGLHASAADLDAELAGTTRWALLHDLHLQLNGRSLWIDHILINRQLDILVLESPHYGADLRVDAQGRFSVLRDGRELELPSPLARCARHLAGLRQLARQLPWPHRQGSRVSPCWLSAILIAPHAQLDAHPRYQDPLVRPAALPDWLASHTRHPERSTLDTLAHSISVDTLRGFARQLAQRHCAEG